MQSLEVRAQKGKEIADIPNAVTRLDENTYKVHSQTTNAIYEVVSTENGWNCNCKDAIYRPGIKCKHAWSVEWSFAV